MPELYIHGGMMKTGTTYLQRFLAINRTALKEQNTVFPDFSDLFAELYPPDGGSQLNRNARWLSANQITDPGVKAGLERIGELSEKYSKIIISDEALWDKKTANKRFWRILLETLKPYDLTVKLVVYLKRQDEFLYSFWSQNIKTTKPVAFKTDTFAQFLEEGYAGKRPTDYLDILKRAERMLGRENIIVRVYERGQFGGCERNLKTDFLNAVGLKDDCAYEEPPVLQNVSLKDSVLETKRYLNRLPGFVQSGDRPAADIYPYLLSVQLDLEKEGLLQNRTGFSNAQRREIMRQFEEDNGKIARRYLGRKNRRLFYETIPEEEEEEQDFTTGELIEVCGRVMLKMTEREEELLKNQKKPRHFQK